MNLAKIIHKIELVKLILCKRFCTVTTIIKYSLYPNIIFGKKNSFVGFTKFRNYPGGSITIGDKCSFLSSATSNLIGINHRCMLSTMTKNATITIGDGCGFSGTVVGAFLSISLGKNVRCGANTLITDGDWHCDDRRSGPPKEVIIENNVWLGEGVKVLKGVLIGENSLIGAGSVVTKNIPANVVAAGNPCKIIKSLLVQ